MGAELATQGGELASHDRLLEDVSDRLRASGLSLAVAESCTGGLLGGALTDVPGASDYFVGGILAYDNAVKVSLLGVSPELIESHGAVSVPVVRAMAGGVRQLLGVHIGVAVTGISGPEGGTDEKPVGTTFLALSTPDMETIRQFRFSGDRAQVRAQAVQAALALLHEYLEGHILRKSTER